MQNMQLSGLCKVENLKCEEIYKTCNLNKIQHTYCFTNEENVSSARHELVTEMAYSLPSYLGAD